ncbi:MAG TPA: phosphatase PAP2 family protein [Polyangiaceae bacterium]|jgi:membrane-associated phospholipid phosphatase
MARRSWLGAGAALLVMVGSPAASAQTHDRSLRWDPALDATVTVLGLGAWVASELLKGELAPSECRWCAANGLDSGVREALVWKDPAAADRLSNVTGFLLVPALAIGLDALAAAHEGGLGGAPEDALLMTEAAVIAADVNQLAKLVVGRERPFVHALPPEEKARNPHPSDNDLSFFSGHTTEAFAIAAASGTIGELRGYRWAPLAWGVGGAFAATTGYLRIGADKHWLTDVVVGALVGVGIGVALPVVFHPAEDTPSPVTTTGALAGKRLPAPVVPNLSFVW